MSEKEIKQFKELELSLVHSLSGLPKEAVEQGDIKIDSVEYMHYIRINAETVLKKSRLLMIHGYGGNNVVFYRMYQHLSSHFEIISVDLPGMGFNYRLSGEIPFTTLSECIEFFVVRIRRFVDAIGWDRFNLLGHSMGGFFAGHFFDAYAERVENLYLLSPAGFNRSSPDAKTEISDRLKKYPLWKRLLIRANLTNIVEKKKSPFELANKMMRNFMIQSYFHSKRFQFQKNEAATMTKLAQFLLGLPQCGEKCIGFILDWGLQTREPLIEVIMRHKKRLSDIAVFYGERDWMDWNLSLHNSRKIGLHVNFFKIDRCDHQLILQNPAMTSQVIILFHEKKSHLFDVLRLKPKSHESFN